MATLTAICPLNAGICTVSPKVTPACTIPGSREEPRNITDTPRTINRSIRLPVSGVQLANKVFPELEEKARDRFHK